ncbi:efflux RND transporter permease subunit [Microbacterium sp. 18062]|uniref:efflux RND transporter permease subunit n=1 Tax=Microbacterium sp. 18062 TaxID=2681410 RepID=UPI0013586C70|nr:efflux RND transporter permease subunit [Microbacterium sp. 18062]
MSTLLYSLGRWSFRHPWRVLVGWVVVLVLAGGAMAVLSEGTDDSFSIPGTESQAGLEQLNRTFPQVSGTNAQFIVVAAPGESVTAEVYRTAVDETITHIEGLDGVLAVTDPYGDTVQGSISDDAAAAIVRLQFDGQATDVPEETRTDLEETVAGLEPLLPEGAQVQLGGDLFAVSLPGVTITELLGLVIALLVLIVTFRSFVVAGLPLLTAVLGVGLSMALIFVATAFATISSTTPLLALMLGLAVGIDYSLFIISRHQDQTRAGVDPEESAARATGTAGSAVVFAGITVLIALIGLGFAGIPFLTTMGVAAAVAVAIAVAVAVTLTPALLGFVGGRVLGWRRRPSARGGTAAGIPNTADATAPGDARAAAGAAPARRGFAARWVGLVTRHPVVTTVAVVVALGVTAIPAASLALALPNAGQLPQDDPARVSYDLTEEHFGPGANGPLIMTGTIVTSNDPVTLMDDLGDEIARIPGVKEVALATPNETADTGIVQIVPETAPDDPATAELVRELRAQHDRLLEEYGVDLQVTGFTAVAIDISDRLGAALLPFGVFVVGLSLVLLMIVFRSVWVPIKAALGYLLSVAASFGIVAAVFEWGWFADLLHVAKVGPVISFMPIVLMGVLFGLAMDYEVFLVSRMREDFVHARRAAGGRSTRRMAIDTVRSGFTASARVVTAAAVIMFAVFAAFVPEGDSSLKPIALGLAAGIVIDAFLVRMTLTPAVMALLGERAWWMPRRLDRLLPHFDIEGEAVERELALEGWPERPAAITAEDVTVRAWDGRTGTVTLLDGATFRLEHGHCLVVTGPRAARRALTLAVAGRVDPDAGLLRVAGHLLPGRAAWVRAHVGVALLAGATSPADEVRRALDGDTRIVVIDGLDLLEGDARAEVAALLRDAAVPLRERAGDAASPLTIVAGAADAARAESVLTAALRPHITTIVVDSGGAAEPSPSDPAKPASAPPLTEVPA